LSSVSVKNTISNYLVFSTLDIPVLNRHTSAEVNSQIKLYKTNTQVVEKIKNAASSASNISLVTRSHYDMQGLLKARSHSFRHIDSVFNAYLLKNQVLVKWAAAEYNNQEIVRIFKKQLIEMLSEWNELVYIACCVFKNEKVKILVDTNLFEVAEICQEQGICPPEIEFFCACNDKRFSTAIKYWLQVVAVPFYMLTKIRGITRVSRKRTYDVAIRIHRGIRGKSTQTCKEGYDLLAPYLQEKDLTYCYVIESTPDKKVFNQLIESGENVVDIDRYAFRKVSPSFILKLFIAQLKIIFQSFGLIMRTSGIFHDLIAKLIYDKYRWLYFTDVSDVKWYCSFNNDGKEHLTRNIILEQHNVRTLEYASSWSDYYFLDNASMETFRKPVNAFTYYDTKAYICTRQKEYDALQGAEARQSLITGALFKASQVKPYQDYLNLFDVVRDHDLVVVSVFTASASENTLNDESDLLDFFYMLEDMLQDDRFSNWHFILKQKKLMSDSDNDSNPLTAIYKRLIQSGRFVDVSESGFCASLLIEVSDYVLSMAFTSPTLDAVVTGIPGSFYLGREKYKESIFSENPEIITRSASEILSSYTQFAGMSRHEVADYYVSNIPLGCKHFEDIDGIGQMVEFMSEMTTGTGQ